MGVDRDRLKLTAVATGARMMALVFAGLCTALLLGWWGRRGPAIGVITLTLLLAVHLFLWEVYSPVYGFRLPWIST